MLYKQIYVTFAAYYIDQMPSGATITSPRTFIMFKNGSAPLREQVYDWVAAHLAKYGGTEAEITFTVEGSERTSMLSVRL